MQNQKPRLRGHFHQASFFIALGSCLMLLSECDTSLKQTAIAVYSFGLLFLFGVSALYHRVQWQTSARLKMKRLDHSAIYLMIAGTFTPVALLGLSGTSSSRLLISIWSVALLGIVQSIFFVNVPKWISSILYLIAGYLILPYLSELGPALGKPSIALLIAGGIAYTLGAVSYGLKRPVLKPSIFGYHEVFHVLVCVGALLNFILVLDLVRAN